MRPFFADPTGITDSTKAIQRAVDTARDKRMITYLPPGRYLVSDTIILNQQNPSKNEDPLFGRRDEYPCVIWGGTHNERACLVLADDAPGFDDPARPRPVLYSLSFLSPTQADNPYISFNQMIISLDVELGKGNHGAIGVDHQGAQGTVTEDVHVRAYGAFAGFRGASGSGGGASHISVEGGRYGLYLDNVDPFARFSGSQPCPVISGLVLSGQTEQSIHAAVRGPLTLVGADISGPGIHLTGNGTAWNGALNLIDSVVHHHGDKPAITGNRPVFISDTYFEHAATVVGIDGVKHLSGNPKGWIHVREFAAAETDDNPVWLNGQRTLESRSEIAMDRKPPADLLKPHLWETPLPAWNDAGVVNIRQAPYHARGDGQTDDWAVIQQALDENRNVFVPKGVYRISKPLRLRAENRLFGIGVYSKIEPLPDAAAFSDPDSPQPILIGPDNPAASCTVAFLQLWAHYPGCYALHWQAGGDSMVRNVLLLPRPWPNEAPPAGHPLILIDGNGGGRWYNSLMHVKFPQTAEHRHVKVQGTREPLRFYMLNPEHSNADYMVEFDDVRNVRIYSLKSETLGAGGPRALTPFLIRNSSDFRIYGHGGNAVPAEGDPLYRIVDCSNFVLANFGWQPLWKARFATVPPVSSWSMLEEQKTGDATLRVPATDCFTLFKRD